MTDGRRYLQKSGCTPTLCGNLAVLRVLASPDAAASFDTRSADDMSAAIDELVGSDDKSSALIGLMSL